MIHERSLTTQSGDIRRGEISAGQVVEHYLQRAHRFQPKLNAYTMINERAEEQAAEIDQQVARGEDPGPLAGVPIAVKDLLDQSGAVTTCGSSFHRHLAQRSATVVQRLEEAGAVIIGRTGLHEFAFGFSSENHWFGPVRNPWDPETSPGGSSGGSAVAAAAGLAAGAIGTDTGGSVRVPAALCGIIGLKVTHGRVPLTGVFPLAASLDTVGPMGRSIEDVTALYEAIAGYDPQDPWSSPQPVAGSEVTSLEGIKVGVPQPWVDDAPMTTEVREAFFAALDRLSQEGATVRQIHHSSFIPSRELGHLINGEVAAVHRTWLADPNCEYGPEVADRLEQALAVTLDDYVAAQAWRAGLRQATAAVFDEVDVLVTPATGATRKTIGDPKISVEGGSRSSLLVLSWFSALVNHMGVPALALPLRYSGAPPPSIQLIGPWWSETRLLGLGRNMEEAGMIEVVAPPAW